MFKPIKDILKYIQIFQKYLGVRMYLILLSLIASIFEGIGILMLLPLLQSIDKSGTQDDYDNEIINTINNLIEFLGLSNSMASILILISIAFIVKD